MGGDLISSPILRSLVEHVIVRDVTPTRTGISDDDERYAISFLAEIYSEFGARNTP